MKITTDKHITETGDLQFIITVSDAINLPYTPQEMLTLMGMSEMTKNLLKGVSEESVLYQKIIESSSQVKEYIFNKMMRGLKSDIHDVFEPMFSRICQEIYNFHYDNQPEHIRSWMSDYDNVRTEYYFDNDVRNKRNEMNQEPEYPIDVDDSDEDDND